MVQIFRELDSSSLISRYLRKIVVVTVANVRVGPRVITAKLCRKQKQFNEKESLTQCKIGISVMA